MPKKVVLIPKGSGPSTLQSAKGITMRRLLTGFWCVAAIISCKSIAEMEDTREFASGRFSKKDGPDSTANSTVTNTDTTNSRVEVPSSTPNSVPTVSQSRAPAGQYTPPADSVSQSGDLRRDLQGNWVSTCQAVEGVSDRAWYQRISLSFENVTEGVLTLAIYSDNACQKVPSQAELNSARLSAKSEHEFGFLLGETYSNRFVAFDFSLAGEPTLFLAVLIEGNQLTMTRSCLSPAIKAKLCQQLSGTTGAQRALDAGYVQKFQKR